MVWYVLGLIVFFCGHHVRQVAPNFRQGMIGRFGLGTWIAGFSALSLVGVSLIVMGWMALRPDAPDIYLPPDWGADANRVLSAIAFVVLGTLAAPAGWIRRIVRYPLPVGLLFWSAGHLLANGDALSVSLFGLFSLSSLWSLIWSVGHSEPVRPFQTIRGDLMALVIGLAAYCLFAFVLHGWLFGVSPY
ncbi:MAG: NnrU family protein [Hyphomicrobiaceae bacterium]|nr:NnrU family protein [Hyphomicrobiaceae bacterium]